MFSTALIFHGYSIRMILRVACAVIAIVCAFLDFEQYRAVLTKLVLTEKVSILSLGAGLSIGIQVGPENEC